MKIILLAANGGDNPYFFPFWLRKPKHLYHVKGQVQLKRVIDEILKADFKQHDIEIVVGFGHKKVSRFLKDNGYNIKVKINHHWHKSSAYTVLTAIEGVDDDLLLFCADQYGSKEFIKYVAACPLFLNSETLRLDKAHIPLLKKTATDYLDKKAITDETNFFASTDNSNFVQSTHSGVGLFFLLAKAVQKIDGYENSKQHYAPEAILGDNYKDREQDCDSIFQTDEYKNGSTIFRVAALISLELVYMTIYSKLAVKLCLAKDKTVKQKLIHVKNFIVWRLRYDKKN